MAQGIADAKSRKAKPLAGRGRRLVPGWGDPLGSSRAEGTSRWLALVRGAEQGRPSSILSPFVEGGLSLAPLW
jgi:hypothetical protein